VFGNNIHNFNNIHNNDNKYYDDIVDITKVKRLNISNGISNDIMCSRRSILEETWKCKDIHERVQITCDDVLMSESPFKKKSTCRIILPRILSPGIASSSSWISHFVFFAFCIFIISSVHKPFLHQDI